MQVLQRLWLSEGDRNIMNRNPSVRTIIILVVIGIFVFGLTSCKLPASKGPQSTSNGFPAPAGSETSSGIDVSTFATQTAQALPPVVISTATAGESPAASPVPGATSVPPAPAPTEAPIVYVQATPGGPPAEYTLAKGEFPFCIARRFNVDINELLSLNGLTTSSSVSPGQVLKIPQTGNPFVGERALKPHPDYYKIKSGDTLNTIACTYGDVSPDMIALQNNLTSDNYSPGDVILIP
jgi:LysM repeat protein